MSNWHGGKGSKRRNSNEKSYAENWDVIFGNSTEHDESDDLEYAKRIKINTDLLPEEDHDTMPDVEVLEKIVKKELNKMEKFNNESKK